MNIQNMATVRSRSIQGLTSSEVSITAVAAADGIFEISGMDAAGTARLKPAACRELRVRVVSALAQLGLRLGAHVAIVGPVSSMTHLDLAVAAAVLAAHGRAIVLDSVVVGELALDGTVRAIRAAGPLLAGCKAALGPEGNAAELSRVAGCKVRTVATLRDLLDGESRPVKPAKKARAAVSPVPMTRIPEGLEAVLTAVREGKARGVLMLGKPGCGFTMVAREIAASLEFKPSAELDAVYSVAGILPMYEGTVTRAPFRAPHHTVSEAGLVGGVSPARPGEASLAHGGVLFLDSLDDFRGSALESLFGALRRGTAGAFPAKPVAVVACAGDTPRAAKLAEKYELAIVRVDSLTIREMLAMGATA